MHRHLNLAQWAHAHPLLSAAIVAAFGIAIWTASRCSARADRRRPGRPAARPPASRAAWPEPSARDHVVYSSMTHLRNVEEARSCGLATAADVREARDALQAARRASGPAASRAAHRRFHHIGRS